MEPPGPEAIPRSLAHLRDALGPGAAASPLWPSLARLDWVAAVPNAAAPAYVYLAAAVGGVAVGGGGGDLAGACARLAGEAAEVVARAAAGDAPPSGLGLAAGPDPGAARLAGLLELIERDAVAAWWLDGVRPHACAPAVRAGAEARLARLRAGAEVPRSTCLLSLVSPSGVPVVCAMSREAAGGGMAFGFKAALDPSAAAEGAIVELLQMEIALELARHRAENRASTPDDQRILRLAALDAAAFAAFEPLAAEPARPGLATLERLLAHLAGQGCDVVAMDFAVPPGGLAVASVTATGLRPFPGSGRANQGAPGAVAALM